MAPPSAKVGAPFSLLVTGAIGGGRVDFIVAGVPAGTLQPDAAGRVSFNASAWSTGTVKVEAVWTRFVVGVPIEKVVSALVTVT